MDKVVVVGQGYVGLPLSMSLVSAGCMVVGLDVSQTRVESLRSGTSYVDDVTDEDLVIALDTDRFHPTTSYEDVRDFSVAVITVPTPLRQRSPDLSFIEDSVRRLAPYLTPGALVILESTTYPGTTEDLVVPLLETGSGLVCGEDFLVGYSPERVDPGNGVWTLSTTPKVVSGVGDNALKAVSDFYSQVVARVVPVSSTRAAELTKLLENTFRHVNIALVNELAIFARELGIDVWEVIDAAATKPFGYMRFAPGPGVGGHCLPIDPAYLSWQVEQATGRNFRFVQLARDINDHMPDYVVDRLSLGLNRRGKPVRGSTILLLGLSYKKNSGDARESPARRIIDLLDVLGAELWAADPHVPDESMPNSVRRVDLDESVVGQADAVVLVTDHDLCDYDLVLDHAAYVLDCRNRLSGPRVEAL